MRYAIGVDLGGTAVRAGIVSDEGAVLVRHQEPRLAEPNCADEVVQQLTRICRHLCAQSGGLIISAIGVGISGCVSAHTGVVKSSWKIPVLEGFPFASSLGHEAGLPVFIDNSTNNAGRGEHLFGAARGLRSFVLVTIGTGIGGALFSDGKLMTGKAGFAGEAGHMVLVPDGRSCGCGGAGCWEAYGSGRALVTSAVRVLEKGVSTALAEGSELTAASVVDEARRGDAVALALVDEWCRWNGIGIANLITLLDCEACIVAGGVSAAGGFILGRMKAHAQRIAMAPSWQGCDVLLAELTEDAGLVGSAALSFMEHV